MTGTATGISGVRTEHWFAIVMLAVSTSGSGQHSGGEFELRESLLSAGGGPSAQQEFELHGSIGQAHVNSSSSGPYELFGGLWTPDASDHVFRDSWEG